MTRNIRRTSSLVPMLAAFILLTQPDNAAILRAADAPEAVLPPGVKAVWNLETAQRETTPTRERVCLNGLWRWQPARRERTPFRRTDGAFSRRRGSGQGVPATTRRTAKRFILIRVGKAKT